MKKFIYILVLAVVAMLTTCTPCEAKGKHETVVASVFVKYLSFFPSYEKSEAYESDKIACDSAIEVAKNMSDEYRCLTWRDGSWITDIYVRKKQVRNVSVIECYLCSPVSSAYYRPDANEFFERLQDVYDESWRSRFEFYRQVVLK